MKKFEFIDSLRGIAILLVLMVHCNQSGINNYPSVVSNVFNLGLTGVQLFFIISAFTIFHSHHSRQEGVNGTSKFFIRRFLRIAPMYYIGVFYYLWQDGFGERYWLGDHKSVSIGNILSNLTFTHNFYPYYTNSIVPGGWTIGVEMIFYLAVPLLCIYIKSLRWAIYFLFLTLIIKTACHVLMAKFILINDVGLWQDYISISFFSNLPYFAMGMVAYFLFRLSLGLRPLKYSIFIIIVCLFFVKKDSLFIDPRLCMGFFYLSLTYLLSQRPVRILVNPILSFFGRISFSLYIVHFALLHWMDVYGLTDFIPNLESRGLLFGVLNFGLRYLLLATLGAAISWITYSIVEQPFVQLSKKIIRYYEGYKLPNTQ